MFVLASDGRRAGMTLVQSADHRKTLPALSNCVNHKFVSRFKILIVICVVTASINLWNTAIAQPTQTGVNWGKLCRNPIVVFGRFGNYGTM